MPQEIAIRRAEAADAPRIRELNEVALRQVDAYAEDAVGLGPDEPSVAAAPEDAVESGMNEDLEDVEANYVDVGGDFLVAELPTDDDSESDDETAIVGMGALEPTGDATFQADRIVRPEDEPAGEITRMRIDPAFQRRGIATRLVERLEARARDLGYETLVLDTTARQTGAQRLYEGFGYTHEETVEWRDFEVMLYRKALDEA